jgi:hypothetical protein
MGDAFGAVDDVLLDSGVVMRGSCRCGAVRSVVKALKLSRRVKEARRVAIYVFSMIKKMLLKTLRCCRNAIRDVGQFAAS